MSTTTNFKIVNPSTSGATDDQVYICFSGLEPTDASQRGYLDFSTNKFVYSANAGWQFKPGTMSKTLSEIRTLQGLSPTDDLVIPVPPIMSARMYISVFADLPVFPNSGPTMSKGNTVFFDKVEFDTSTSDPNINPTCVDFYGISYTVEATDSSGTAHTVGFTAKRSDVISAFNNFKASTNTSQKSGNTNIFKYCMFNNGTNVTRVLAPKTPGLGDWGSTQPSFVEHATQCSHFLDEYVNQHCWKPNRKFKFYSKLYNPSTGANNEIYYGEITSDGTGLNVYTDANYTTLYTGCTMPLPRPSAAWPNPDFSTNQSLYHNVNSNMGTIDWGFLLLGNSGGVGEGAYWATDPVAMAVMVSICRGVMHMDDGTKDWVNPDNYYQGNGSNESTEDMPIFYYSKLLHQLGLNGTAYALSLDDVYGQESSIHFAGYPNVTIKLNSMEVVAPSTTANAKSDLKSALA